MTVSRKTLPLPRIHLYTSDLNISCQQCRRRYPFKIVLLWQSLTLKRRSLNVLEYIYHCPFFLPLWPAVCGIFPNFFICHVAL